MASQGADAHRRYWCYNLAIRAIGETEVKTWIEKFAAAYPQLPIVSVGSGLGLIESQLPALHWIGVDPDPTSFQPFIAFLEGKALEPYLAPAYAIVSTLIKDKPQIVGQCLVFLNWCDNHDYCDDYDYQAIVDLKPVSILVVGERHGCSNGKKFRAWLQSVEAHNQCDPDYYVKDVARTWNDSCAFYLGVYELRGANEHEPVSEVGTS